MAKYVWRVEDDTGLGPYQGNKYELKHMIDYHNENRSRWPTPQDESIPIEYLLCGFRSKAQAQAWFRGYWRALKRCGFTLKRIEASEVHYGKKQVTFKRANKIKSYEETDHIPF